MLTPVRFGFPLCIVFLTIIIIIMIKINEYFLTPLKIIIIVRVTVTVTKSYSVLYIKYFPKQGQKIMVIMMVTIVK
jgi:hypothetical protein